MEVLGNQRGSKAEQCAQVYTMYQGWMKPIQYFYLKLAKLQMIHPDWSSEQFDACIKAGLRKDIQNGLKRFPSTEPLLSKLREIEQELKDAEKK